jgi:phosphoribosylanthranilate isomerase
MNTRTKICGIGTIEDALISIEAGADALGFNCVNPPSPRSVAEAVVAEIAPSLPPPVETFLLTSECTAESIARQLRLAGTSTVQILSHIDPAESERLMVLAPDVRRVQVLHVESRAVLEMISVYSPYVDAFLLDSGRPNLAVPAYGGTGSKHDWNISAEFVETSGLPVFLAGGLTPENVVEAILHVKPFGVDVMTGVRTKGRLDPSKIIAFVAAVRRADELRLSD